MQHWAFSGTIFIRTLFQHDCAVAFSESGRQMAVGSETCVYVWDITNVDNVNHGATTPTIAGAFEQPDSETNVRQIN